MYHFNSCDEWNSIHRNDTWVYNKLLLNQSLGHLCGLTGCPVPYSEYYIVRPCINLLGMGRFSRIEWIDKDTEHFHPSEFWCEIFEGPHLSVDFHHQKSELVVLGERDDNEPLYKWKRWTKIDQEVEYPEILKNLKGDYDWINCEFIGNRLIEVHFRRNPDFRYGNSIAIPVWKGDRPQKVDNFTFIEDKDYLRRGFFIDSRDSNPVKSSVLPNMEEKTDGNEPKSR
jgi:hypothetical protein